MTFIFLFLLVHIVHNEHTLILVRGNVDLGFFFFNCKERVSTVGITIYYGFAGYTLLIFNLIVWNGYNVLILKIIKNTAIKI